MSERERWIVYPLLFLALGAALRDKLLKQTRNDVIICEKLECDQVVAHKGFAVVDPQQRVIASMAGRSVQVSTVQAEVVDARLYRQAGQPLATRQWIGQFLDFLVQSGQLLAEPPTPPRGAAPPPAAEPPE